MFHSRNKFKLIIISDCWFLLCTLACKMDLVVIFFFQSVVICSLEKLTQLMIIKIPWISEIFWIFSERLPVFSGGLNLHYQLTAHMGLLSNGHLGHFLWEFYWSNLHIRELKTSETIVVIFEICHFMMIPVLFKYFLEKGSSQIQSFLDEGAKITPLSVKF